MTEDELMALLGHNINHYRNLRSITVEQLAEKASISPGHLADILHGRTWLGAKFLVRIADALSVPIQALFAAKDSGGSTDLTATITALGAELTGKLEAVINETTKAYLDRSTK